MGRSLALAALAPVLGPLAACTDAVRPPEAAVLACVQEAGVSGTFQVTSTLRTGGYEVLLRPGPDVTLDQAATANACIARLTAAGAPQSLLQPASQAAAPAVRPATPAVSLAVAAPTAPPPAPGSRSDRAAHPRSARAGSRARPYGHACAISPLPAGDARRQWLRLRGPLILGFSPMLRRLLPLLALPLLAACQTGPVDPLVAARLCEERARAAQAPSGEVAVGASSSDGPFAAVGITLSSDYLSGRDPFEVYRTCVVRRTGAEPVRPPAL